MCVQAGRAWHEAAHLCCTLTNAEVVLYMDGITVTHYCPVSDTRKQVETTHQQTLQIEMFSSLEEKGGASSLPW